MFVKTNVQQYFIMYYKEEEVNMQKTDSIIGVRVSSELKKQIEAQAAKEHRSMSNLVVKIITEYLERMESDQK